MDAGKALPLSQMPADGVIAQLTTLLRALAGSRRRGRLGLLALGAVVVICANAAGQIGLNRWQGAFYEAIEQRQVAAFMTQLMVFAAIACVLLVLVVSQTWLQAMINVRLREWLTYDLLDQWLIRKRVYLLGFAGEIGVNPDQRIQQDAQHLTELTTSLAIGLLQSSLLLTSFAGVLWLLSDQVVFNLGNGPVTIPGYMVWCALAYSLGGSLLAWHVGRPLIPLDAERYAREADLRVALVRISEHGDGIVLYDGEADEPARRAGRRRGDLDDPPGGRPRAPYLDHVCLWLAGARGADRGRGAGLFRRLHELRHAHDGGRRLQSGAVLLALVRGQPAADRRLARHPSARRRLP
jgi:putative ATP-binding cassette transporter